MAEENREEKSKKIPMIQVKNLYKVYKVGDTKVYALGGVDFTIYKGEFLCDCRSLRFRKVHSSEHDGRIGEALEGGDSHCREAY